MLEQLTAIEWLKTILPIGLMVVGTYVGLVITPLENNVRELLISSQNWALATTKIESKLDEIFRRTNKLDTLISESDSEYRSLDIRLNKVESTIQYRLKGQK